MEFGASNNLLASLQSTGASLRTVISSAANPTYSWTGDSDTGLFNDAANSIGFAIGGSEAMRLNSTGLGVGASPATKLDVRGATNASQATFSGTAGRGLLISTRSDSLADDRTVVLNAQFATGSLGQLVIQTAGTDRLLVDSSGNVGIGVTPSAKLHVEGGGAQARFSIASASDARHEYYRNGIREGLITWDANVIGLYATQSSGEVVIASSNTLRVRVKAGGQVRFVPLASDPAGAEAGDVYYNSTSNKLKCYNGTTWNDLF